MTVALFCLVKVFIQEDAVVGSVGAGVVVTVVGAGVVVVVVSGGAGVVVVVVVGSTHSVYNYSLFMIIL